MYIASPGRIISILILQNIDHWTKPISNQEVGNISISRGSTITKVGNPMCSVYMDAASSDNWSRHNFLHKRSSIISIAEGTVVRVAAGENCSNCHTHCQSIHFGWIGGCSSWAWKSIFFSTICWDQAWVRAHCNHVVCWNWAEVCTLYV